MLVVVVALYLIYTCLHCLLGEEDEEEKRKEKDDKDDRDLEEGEKDADESAQWAADESWRISDESRAPTTAQWAQWAADRGDGEDGEEDEAGGDEDKDEDTCEEVDGNGVLAGAHEAHRHGGNRKI